MTELSTDLNAILDAEARAYGHYFRLEEKAKQITKELKSDVVRGGIKNELLPAVCDALNDWEKIDNRLDFSALDDFEMLVIDLWYRKGFCYYGWDTLKRTIESNEHNHYGKRTKKQYQNVVYYARKKVKLLY